MTTIFRKLSQKRHWDRPPWLGAGDIQADAAKCLRTEDNKLSVFRLEDSDVQTERVVAALALTRDNLAHVDLAIAPEKVLEACGIQHAMVPARTPDSEVNDWHLDLVELTVAKIAELATAISTEGRIRRYYEADVKAAIQKSLRTDYIVVEHIKPKLVQSLKKDGIDFPAGSRSSF